MEANKAKEAEQVVNEPAARQCLVCRQREVEFRCFPCECEVLCKHCAMKLATGGKCRKCKQLFSEVERIRED